MNDIEDRKKKIAEMKAKVAKDPAPAQARNDALKASIKSKIACNSVESTSY